MDIIGSNASEKKGNPDWLGWVCAYVAFNGLAFNAYVGKVIAREGMLVTLDSAFEYSSVTQYGQGGQIGRAFIGAPIEFSSIGQITVTALGIIELGMRRDEEISCFIAARKEAKEKLMNTRKGSNLIAPVSQLPSSILNHQRR